MRSRSARATIGYYLFHKGRACHPTIGRFALLLRASNSLVLEYPDYDSPVFFLAFSRLVTAYLPAFAHSPGRQHIGQRDVALLLKKLGDTVGPVLAQFLVQRSAAY